MAVIRMIDDPDWCHRFGIGLLGTDPNVLDHQLRDKLMKIFTKLPNIRKEFAAAKPGEKQQMREFVQVNSEGGYAMDFPQKGYYRGQMVMLDLVWTLRVMRHLDTGRKMLCAGWAYSDGSLPGITTDQMREVVGLPPLRRIKKTKANPQGLKSRSAGAGGVSLGKVSKPKPRKARR